MQHRAGQDGENPGRCERVPPPGVRFMPIARANPPRHYCRVEKVLHEFQCALKRLG